MADALEQLRAEYAELATRRTRAAIVTLTILLIAVLGYVKAFERIGRVDVKSRLEGVQRLIDQTRDWRNTSYVFAWSLNRTDVTSTLDGPAYSYGGAERQLVDAVDKLEQDAAVWFEVKVSLFGASIEGDLRYWILALPPLLLLANFYLFVTGAKLDVVRRMGRARLTAEAQPVDALLFGDPKSAYERYPARLAALLYGIAIFALVGWLVAAARPMWQYWTPQITAALIYVSVALILWIAVYAISIRERLNRQAEAIIAMPPHSYAVVRFHRWLCSLPVHLRAWCARVPRLITLSGTTLVLLTLILPMAETCHEVRTGRDIAFHMQKEAWFVSDWLPNSLGDFIAPWVYRLVLALAAVTSIAVFVSFLARRIMPRYARFAAPLAIVLAWYFWVDVGFGYPADAVMLMADPFRIALFVVPFMMWIRWPRSNRERLRRRRERLWLFLVAVSVPALIRLPITLVEVVIRGLPGIAVFFAGVMIMAAGLDAARGEVVVTDAVLPPEPVRAVPAA